MASSCSWQPRSLSGGREPYGLFVCSAYQKHTGGHVLRDPNRSPASVHPRRFGGHGGLPVLAGSLFWISGRGLTTYRVYGDIHYMYWGLGYVTYDWRRAGGSISSSSLRSFDRSDGDSSSSMLLEGSSAGQQQIDGC
jgi:hypothetical protein